MRTQALALLLALPAPLLAQHEDFRNIDRGGPVSTEDAFPIETGVLELMLLSTLTRNGGNSDLMLEPELMWGAFERGMIGIGAPLALGDQGGVAGFRPFVFYNFLGGDSQVPAFALRADAALPIGALGGDGVVGSIAALFTRRFGPSRLHLNVGAGLGAVDDAPLDDAPPRWRVSFGIDQVLLRDRAVFVADVELAEPLGGGDKEWLAGAGVRMEVATATVFDIGVARRLSRWGTDLFLNVGITRAFGDQ